jgi:hypothetical protein
VNCGDHTIPGQTTICLPSLPVTIIVVLFLSFPFLVCDKNIVVEDLQLRGHSVRVSLKSI